MSRLPSAYLLTPVMQAFGPIANLPDVASVGVCALLSGSDIVLP